jgi:NAD+ synthase (glutamine-hydrolysing)
VKILTAQFNPKVGDLEHNADRILDLVEVGQSANADLIVFPELSLCGYPPEDLLLRPSMKIRVDRALQKIASAVNASTVVLGFPHRENEQNFNAAAVIRDGKIVDKYHKQVLPNYRVFDEKRYFAEGDTNCLITICGHRVGITICEDLWHDHPIRDVADAGAELIININASPFHTNKHLQRAEVLARQAKKVGVPILYANLVGGQDELVFDGDSMLVNKEGNIVYQAPWFKESADIIDINLSEVGLGVAAMIANLPQGIEATYEALVLGVRDYVDKNGFPTVVLGLSGGIDSAVTLAIAVDALGADRVRAVMMPFHYTSDLSQDLAAQQAETMGVHYRSIDIESIFDLFSDALTEEFSGLAADVTEQNIQARIRGVILMAISNKKGSLVLTTGNKSEVAVGYSTLYGDMAGGFDVLKDVLKTRVYELAHWRNGVSQVIPEEVITRAPSAELAPDQVDQDSLPDYPELDQILEKYIEQDMSANEIISQGFARDTVERMVRLVDRNEYKRRQAAVGPRISQRAFGRDRRYPITNGWQPGD